MSLNFVREVIGRAVLDHSFRQSLLTNPGQALQGYQLTGPEKQALQGITPQQFQALEDLIQGSIGGAGGDAAVGEKFFPKIGDLAGEKQLGDVIGYKEFGHVIKLMGDGSVIKLFEGFLHKDEVMGKHFPKLFLPAAQRNRRSLGWLLPAILIGLLLFFGFLFLGPTMPVLGMFGLSGAGPASFGDGSVIPTCSVNPGPPDVNPGPPNMTLPQQLLLLVSSFRTSLGAQPLMCKSGPDPEAGSGGTCGDQCRGGEWCVAGGGPGQCAIYCIDANYDGVCEGYRCIDADGDHVCDLISWTTCSDTPPGVVCSSGDPQGTCAAGLTCSPDAAGTFTCRGETCTPPAEGGTPATEGGRCMDKCDPNDPNSCLAGLSCVPRSTTAAGDTICYNQQICNPSTTQEPTEAVGTEQPCVCGDGICEQARCNELQQNCPADCGSGQPQPPANPCDKSCGNGACEPNCQEDTATCPADCKGP